MKLLKALAVFLLSCGVLYLVGAFVQADFDIKNWSENGRSGVGLVAAASFFINLIYAMLPKGMSPYD